MISIIIPFYNEEENIPTLLEEIEEAMHSQKEAYEIVLVDDGSQKKYKLGGQKNETIQLLTHRKRIGKGAALKTGIQAARGDTVIFMDGDLQDDPHDIPLFLTELGKGNELVNGVRAQRSDSFLIRFYSSFANNVLRRIFKSPFTDINCGFKACKREVLEDAPLYANNFRFLPLWVALHGYQVSEVAVHNRKRIHGKSKFGTTKVFVGMLDMMTAYFVYRFAEKPLHFFGMIGGTIFSLGFFISLYLSIERIFYHVLLYRRPLLWLGIVLMIIGIQFIMTGLIADLIVYHHTFTRSKSGTIKE
jgi:glycosyltransferase involved in cell wall biosynthesis